MDQDRLGPRLRRVIALVTDSNNPVAQSQRKQNFRRRRQQGTDFQSLQFTTGWKEVRLAGSDSLRPEKHALIVPKNTGR
jgi:hypothetical protein